MNMQPLTLIDRWGRHSFWWNRQIGVHAFLRDETLGSTRNPLCVAANCGRFQENIRR